jgi:hypothetical protein
MEGRNEMPTGRNAGETSYRHMKKPSPRSSPARRGSSTRMSSPSRRIQQIVRGYRGKASPSQPILTRTCSAIRCCPP